MKKPQNTDEIVLEQKPVKPGKVYPYKLYISVSRPNGLASTIKIPNVPANCWADVEAFLNTLTFGKRSKP